MKGDTLRGRRVLITGISGFLGTKLAESLIRNGAEVVGLLRDWDPSSEIPSGGFTRHIQMFSGRLQEYSDVERAIVAGRCDAVIHLGAQADVAVARRSPLETFASNIAGTYNVMDACRVHSDLVTAVVVASSDKAYGASTALPYTEELPLRGQNPYDVSKSCADLIAQSYYAAFGVPVAIARCGNIYGPGDKMWSRLIPGTIRSALEDEPPIIRSDGNYVRDYVYVDDVVSAYETLLLNIDRPQVAGEAFNFAPQQPATVLEVVTLICARLNKNIQPVILDQATGEIREQYLSYEKAKQVLGWRPRVSLEEGIDRAIQWYDSYLREVTR